MDKLGESQRVGRGQNHKSKDPRVQGPKVQGSKGEGMSERKMWSRLLEQAGGVQQFSSSVPEVLSPIPH